LSRPAAIVFLTCFVGFLVIVTTAKAALELLATNRNLEPHRGDGHTRVVGKGQIRFDGFGPEKWALRFRRERELTRRLLQRLHRQRYVILHRPDVVEALELAATVYGHGDELWRKARCESGLDPSARNTSSAASGLLQFLPSTFRSTPYGRFDIYSPYANALAGGWMLANGRGNEWVCR
jgi:Transglycosylase SLT domain